MPEVTVPDVFKVTDDDRTNLSKVLFPDTHTQEVTVLGIKRKLKPLPIKYSKQLKVYLDPITEKIGRVTTELSATGNVDVPEVKNEELMDALMGVLEILAKFYGWTDVLENIKNEGGELTSTELQAVAVTQEEVCGTNDFLLGGLRLVIKTLQMAEIFHLKFQNILSMQLSARPSDAPLTTSSSDTPKDSLPS